MTASKGRWYVIGWDIDRQATRMFKLSRITDLPRRVSRPGAYEVPADLDLRALARSLAPPEPTRRRCWPSGRARARACVAAAGRRAPAELPLPGGFEVVGSATPTCGPWPRRSPATPPTWWCWSRPSCARRCWACCAGWRHSSATSREATQRSRRRTAVSQVMTSQAQVRRLLSLVPYLREHDGAP